MRGTPIIIATHTDPLSGAIVEQHQYGDDLGWLKKPLFVARWPMCCSPFHVGTGDSPGEALSVLFGKGMPRRMAA